ncbi:MAG: alpha-mannosidase, partial [Candidatus Omnitrophica bacterium]|nr:alpha-mannosidase [Candidatus Omnitrophota bacterium]
MGKEVRKVHFVVSTHWDREWYESFQGFRVRLVNMFDELLEVMEKDPRFKYFQTDGQSIVLEDYLEIRPERAAKVRALVEEGRLETGPWYVLP